MKAATVLNLAKVDVWLNKNFCENILREGLNSLKTVYLKLFYDQKDSEEDNTILSLPSNSESDGEGQFFNDLMKDDDFEQNNKESEMIKIELELEREVIKLAELLSKHDKISKINSNKKFWQKNIDEMPRLTRLATVLLNINVSSAFIERFFSICGIICKKNSGNMRDETIITRSMLKANINILEELT